MTVVNPKSISGINSITTGSGSDNLLTIHTSDASSTERVRINSSGDVIVGSGITVSPDGDIFATGVTTSTTFVGNLTGNATGLSGTPNISAGTIAGSTGTFTGNVDIAANIRHIDDSDTYISFPADNEIEMYVASQQAIKFTTTSIETGDNKRIDIIDAAGDRSGEIKNSDSGANSLMISADPDASGSSTVLQFAVDGNEKLRINSNDHILTQGITDPSFNNDSANVKILEVSGGGGSGKYGQLSLSGNQNSSAAVGAIKFINRENSNSSSGANANSRNLATIDVYADTSDSNAGDDCGGFIRFVTKSDGGGNAERMRVTSSGNVEITDGDLKISTSGHGINFSATSDSLGDTSEVLDDYEEGTWTPTLAYSGSGSATLSEALGFYTKIGRMVHVIITVTVSAQGSGSGNVNLGGLPYTTSSTTGTRLNGTLTYVAGFSDLNSQVNVYRAGASTHMELMMMNSINPTTAITNLTRSNITSSTTIRGHATYYVD